MRTTISIDDELYEKAAQFCAPHSNTSTVIREAMKVFVRVNAEKRLALLGGKSPEMKPIPRRK